MLNLPNLPDFTKLYFHDFCKKSFLRFMNLLANMASSTNKHISLYSIKLIQMGIMAILILKNLTINIYKNSNQNIIS